MIKINIDQIKTGSQVDGPGIRSVIFFQGCPIRCEGCQNTHLWDDEPKVIMDIDQAVQGLLKFNPQKLVTISGGEPFHQPAALVALVSALAAEGAHILVYSGYTWEQLADPMGTLFSYAKMVSELIDILVDGPFIQAQDHDLINWRGSQNQRPIDIPSTLETGEVKVLDWGDPVITITDGGLVTFPIGLTPILAGVGEAEEARRCGETE